MSETEKMPQEVYDQLESEIHEAYHDNWDHPDVGVSADTVDRSPYRSGYRYARTEDGVVGTSFSVDSQSGHKVPDGTNHISGLAKTDAGKYKTEVKATGRAAFDGVHSTSIGEDERYTPNTTVTRVENGKEVTRVIKNPKAAELVTSLALKKIKQAGSNQNQEAA